MTKVFLRNGSVFRPTDLVDLDMHERLPASVFTIEEHPLTKELLLRETDSFTLPPKMYGKAQRYADRILTTYLDRPNNTGVLLCGEKGSGKSQVARLISVISQKLGMPTVIVNHPWDSDAFNRLMQSIEQDCVVLLDEFEKTFDFGTQRQALSLFDGVFVTKKLFILTCNDKWLIDDHMRNRPGRLFYMIEFGGLEAGFIEEYCLDLLEDKSHIPGIVRVSQMFSEFNFDMLKAMVEEINRYGETPQQVLEMLNARPSTDTEGVYEVVLLINGTPAVKGTYHPQMIEGSPMQETTISINYTPVNTIDPDDDSSTEPTPAVGSNRPSRRPYSIGQTKSSLAPGAPTEFVLRQSHLTKFDADKGQFVYHMPNENVTVRFTRVRYSVVDMNKLF